MTSVPVRPLGGVIPSYLHHNNGIHKGCMSPVREMRVFSIRSDCNVVVLMVVKVMMRPTEGSDKGKGVVASRHAAAPVGTRLERARCYFEACIL